ncbi:trans-sulfuration enzyme family protein [Anthocerotibacter panamensis]|uniref:trans-sulfuration enzyme family protein n=1 Tax=Anthocerotibacter panamensis TaxID=2857077 RepID=UPI001C402E9A
MRIETLAIHAGQHTDPTTGAVIPPIHLSTTFEREADGTFAHGYIYTRSGNPNREALEQCLQALEGGAGAAAFASGSAATMAVFQALAPGDHVLAPTDSYHGTAYLLRQVFIPWGLQVSFVDLTDLDAVAAALQPNTRLVWIETPSNPLLKIVDLAGVTELAHRAGVRVACDNTWATPILQRPFEWGVDVVVHATTKYLGGHSDILGGAVISRVADEFFTKIRAIQGAGGAVPAPFDCWLLLRGIRTLPYRMRAHSENAQQLAHFLEGHPQVERVHYPGLLSHPAHALAQRQMKLPGGMLSFEIKGGRERAFAVAAGVRVFTRATSLGGVESLIEHRASIEGPQTKTPDNLLRLSIGLEHPEDLIADLDSALA